MPLPEAGRDREEGIQGDVCGQVTPEMSVSHLRTGGQEADM